MNDNLLGVISPKALEKQLKIVNSRLEEIQAEVTELEKIKEACLTLMGSPDPEQLDDALSQKASAPKRRKEKKPRAAAEETEAAEAVTASVDPENAADSSVVTH